MINWMLKKTRDPVVEITSEKLESLQKEAKVSVVFYGDLSSVEGEIIQKLAVVDDYNSTHNLMKPIFTLEKAPKQQAQLKYSDLLLIL